MIRLAFVFLVAAALAPGCKSSGDASDETRTESKPRAPVKAAPIDAKVAKKPRRALIKSVGIVPEHPDKKLEIYPERLAKIMGARLTRTKWYASETKGFPAGIVPRESMVRVDIKYDYRVDKKTKVMVCIVAVDAHVRWSDGGTDLGPRDKVLLKRTMTKKQRSMDVSEHVASQIADAVSLAAMGLIKKAELLEADRDRLLILMGGLDDDVVMWALAVAGDRKITSLFDTVVGLLKSKSQSVREAAVGCLIELGDPRAVAHMTKLAKFRDHRMLTIVIDASASLGGQEAEEFLDFLASGHGNATIRKQAKQARKRMRVSRVERD